ncbi:MAG: hypothetical protein QG671_2162 [Actinomycetota bacterium]|nr:hypothetical protein [Actinomycetota bacterium]
MTRHLPVLSEATVEQYARQLVAKAGTSRVLALAAQPVWNGPATLPIDGTQVQVRPCQSALAVWEALLDRRDNDFLVVLTDRDLVDLGDSIAGRLHKQQVEMVEPWGAVASMFGATTVASDLKRAGTELATALTDHRPPGGFPAAASGVVTADVAMRALLASVLRIPAGEVDPQGLLDVSADIDAQHRWQQLPDPVRAAVTDWSRDNLGLTAPLILDIVGSPSPVDAVTVGLVCDVLYTDSSRPAQAHAAAARLEPLMGGAQPEQVQARALAALATGYLGAPQRSDQQRSALLVRSEQLLVDVQWPQGAELSAVLPAGFDARLRALAHALADVLAGDSATAQDPLGRDRVEYRLANLLDHAAARGQQSTATGRAQMAVRLSRWLHSADTAVTTLRAALARQAGEDAWVDRAIADVAAGSSDPQVASVYRTLAERAGARRTAHDAQFARLLAEDVAADRTGDAAPGVEDVLADLVAPLASGQKALMIVVDGMSTSVAAELVDAAVQRNWIECVRGDVRLPVIAALPTLTRYSRSSLFAGQLCDGAQTDEKRTFGALFPSGQLFHKDDLRSALGEQLPASVREAISSDAPVVAVVLNTVDDALAKADPGGIDWTVDAVQHLGPLLDLAGQSGRAVVLTSDHGHVVERGSHRLAADGADARFRSATTGEPGEGEVLLAGRRVLTGPIVAAWREDLRYGNKAAGYHSGAAAAEVTIPFIVLTRTPDRLAAAGWQPAPPQAPPWWLEAARVPVAPVGRPSRREPGTAAQTRVAAGQESLFTIGDGADPDHRPSDDRAPGAVSHHAPAGLAADLSSPGRLLAEGLLASDVYRTQVARHPRGRPSDQIVAQVVTCLVDSGGRSHRDVVAHQSGIAAVRVAGSLAPLQKILNVEGYPVLGVDPDGVTWLLDAAMLRDQFGLRR